jgi:protein-disulfide isomerase
VGIGLFWVKRQAAKETVRRDESATEARRTKPDPWSDEACPVPISSKDPTWGERTAPATMVEFSDFECSFCKKADETVTELERKYGPKKLRVVWKNDPMPSHTKAKPAAMAAMALFDLEGNDAFWRFHKNAFDDQEHLEVDSFKRWATRAGADRKAFLDRSDDDDIAKKIADDTALAAQLGVRGTPTFFVNGRVVTGAQPRAKFEEAIDLALAEAKVEADKGTAADKIYVTLAQRNFKKEVSDKDPQDDHTLYKVPIEGSPARGSKTALVTIVEFGDFQCPYCMKAESTLAELRGRYGDKLRIVWKDNPLPTHKRALPAASFAREARAKKGDEGFWQAHDALYGSQLALEDADLSRIAISLGFDGTSLVSAPPHKKEIDADVDLADALGATGTPTFFIDGRKLQGAQPADKFITIIDEEITKAQGLVAKGVAPESVYDELTKNGSSGKTLDVKDTGPIPSDAPARGGKKPLVVLQEFSDLECPFCKRAEPTLDQVLEEYGDKVKIVWRHHPLPMHPHAHLAAEVAEEVRVEKGDKAFFSFTKQAFEAQPNGLDRASLESMAAGLGVDRARLSKALDAHTHSAKIDADSAVAEKIGLGGTPSFVVGKYVVTGAQPISAFRRAIDRAILEAK